MMPPPPPAHQQPLLMTSWVRTLVVEQTARLHDCVGGPGAHQVNFAVELEEEDVAVGDEVQERVGLRGAHGRDKENVVDSGVQGRPDLVV